MTEMGHGAGPGGLTRALAKPMRAVTRIFGTPGMAADVVDSHRSAHSAVTDCALYVAGLRQPGEWHHAEALAAARKRDDAFVWIGLHEPDIAELADIATTFQLDEFAVEDTVHGSQRPKIEQYGEMIFLVLRTARYVEHEELDEGTEVVETGDVMMFVGDRYVISVRHGDANSLRPVRAELESNPELLAHGPWAVVHGVFDRVVDTYLDVAAMVESDLDDVEAGVFARGGGGSIQRIYQLKRELVEFKRAVVPLQRPLLMLTDGRLVELPKEVRRHFRDVNDHLIRVVEQIVSFDDLLNSILQARLAQVSVEQNNDMRKIASWAAIAALQTAIAGIYGMNFKYMPETGWKFGYPGVLAVMLVSAVALYRWFRRSGWL